MGVVNNKVIFCEGTLDKDLINQLLGNLSNQITIVPTGGKFNFSNFVPGYLYTNRNVENNKNKHEKKENTQNYIIFRDRDFDIEPTSEIKLLQIDKLRSRAFLSHRTCIENYLLNPELIHEYWSTQYANNLENPISNNKWGHKDSPGVDIITKWIEDAARILQDYQAVRWALGNLCQLTASRKQLKTRWIKGTIPNSLTLSDCEERAESLIKDFTNTVQEVTIDKFKNNLHKYLQLFDQEEFWIQKQYLIWFDGKDIQKAMDKVSKDKKLPYRSYNRSYISMDHFSKWAINHIDINQYDDLIELKNKIEQL